MGLGIVDLEAEAAALCINWKLNVSNEWLKARLKMCTFIVSNREDIVFSCFPPVGVLDSDMLCWMSLRVDSVRYLVHTR